ncbi:TPA: hypothetical protein ACIA70_005416, partial [Salmonella enterica subsp. enterica serovar Java]
VVIRKIFPVDFICSPAKDICSHIGVTFRSRHRPGYMVNQAAYSLAPVGVRFPGNTTFSARQSLASGHPKALFFRPAGAFPPPAH